MEKTLKLASGFPFTGQCTYLNTPAYGLLSEDLMEWRQEHDLDYLVEGHRLKDRFIDRLHQVRTVVATFCGTLPGQVYLVPNFSFGWKVLCCGLNKEASVLLLDGDYPSLNWPVLTSRFKEVHTVKASSVMEGAILQAFEKAAPDVFAFSLVQYLNGLQLDQGFIRELKSNYPNTLFVADATQYLGTEIFNFDNSGIDVLGASGYKWMLAGTGNGFFLVHPGAEDRFYSHTKAWEPRPEPFLKGNTHLQNHLEPGHLDSMSIGSLEFSLSMLQEAGMDLIAGRIQELKTYASGLLYENKLLERSFYERAAHAPFFALNLNTRQTKELEDRDVIFAVRGGKVRIGFHFYNKKEDIDRLVKILVNSGNS